MLGHTVEEKEVIKKYMRIIPDKYEQVVVSIKTTLELKTISIEEVTDHLTAAVDHANKRVARTIISGALLVTHEEWMASMKP